CRSRQLLVGHGCRVGVSGYAVGCLGGFTVGCLVVGAVLVVVVGAQQDDLGPRLPVSGVAGCGGLGELAAPVAAAGDAVVADGQSRDGRFTALAAVALGAGRRARPRPPARAGAA